MTTDKDELFECVIPLPDALIPEQMDEPTKSLKHGDHDQSDHGNWAHGGGDGTKENPIRTSSVEEAARALGEGKHVELQSPDQVATLLDRLNELAKEAEAAGTKAKNIDLCNVTVPGTNLFCVESKGIPRVEMPQLKGIPNSGSPASDLPADKRGEVDITEAYLEQLRSSGVSLTEDEALASHLKATQNELNGGKVAGIMAAARAGQLDLNQPIVVSRDGYIVDGHHRWAAKVALEHDGIDDPETDMKIPVVRVDQDILDILESSKQFAADMGLPQVAVKSLKHGDHDQSDHGNWATGGADHQYTGKPRSAASRARMNEHTDRYGDPERRESGRRSGSRNLGREVTEMEIVALESYKGGGYGEINRFLRGTQEGDDWTKDRIDAVKSLALPTTEPMTVTRMMPLFAVEGIAAGQIYEDKGFMSTGKGDHPAQFFHGYPVQMQIEVPAGTPVVDFDNFSGLDGWGNIEREVTLMPNTQLVIDRVEQRDWNRDFGPTETDGLKVYAHLVSSTKSLKHGDHDQTDHGNWAHGNAAISALSATDKKEGEKYLIERYPPDDLNRDSDLGKKLGLTSLEWAAADHYRTQGYMEINNLLRGVGSDWGMEFAPADIRSVQLLDEAMDKSTIKNFETVYRGTSMLASKMDTFLSSLEVGGVYTDPSFVSTSRGKDIAESFATDRPPDEAKENRASLMWEIVLPPGASALDMQSLFPSFGSNEEEVLLDRDTHLRILAKESAGVTLDGEPVYRIKAIAIPTATKSLKHGDHDQSDHGSWAHGSANRPTLSNEDKNKAEAALTKNNGGWVGGNYQHAFQLTDLEVAAAQHYRAFGFAQMNRMMRGQESLTGLAFVPEIVRGAELLEDAMSKASLQKNTTVYRGMHLLSDEAQKFLAGIKSGDVYTDPAFTSTSKSETIAMKFATERYSEERQENRTGIVWQIFAPSGTSALDFDKLFAGTTSQEQEILLAPNTHFKILGTQLDSYTSTGEPIIRVMATVIPTATKSMKHGDHDQSDHGNWADGIVPLAKTPIEQVDALRSWSSNSYNMINGALRNPDTLGAQERGGLREPVQKMQDQLDKLFAGVPKTTKEMTVYRGATGDWVKNLVDQYEATIEKGRVGYRETGVMPQFSQDRFTDQGFTSTTPDKDIALRFSGTGLSGGGYYTGEGRAIFEINIPEGSSVVNVEEFANEFGGFAKFAAEEKEYLLPRGSTFEVADVTPSEEQFGSQGPLYYTIRLDLVPSSTKSVKHADHDQSDHGNWADGGRNGQSHNVVQLGHPYPTNPPHGSTGYREPMSSVALPNGRSVEIQSGGDAVSGGYNGYFVMHNKANGERMGYLDYQSSGSGDDRRVQIAMVETTEGYRGQGVATALLARLVAEFPETKIEPGSTTEDGGRWWQSVKPLLPASSKSYKHADHDQSEHGNWADGERYTAEARNNAERALTHYSIDGYQRINSYLRKTDMSQDEWQTQEFDPKPAIKEIDSLFESAAPLKEPVTVFRGIDSEVAEKMTWKQGDTYTDAAFMSTSLREEVSERFTDYGGKGAYIMQIEVPAGTTALTPSMFATLVDEEEVLLNRGTTLQITGTALKDNFNYIYATVVPTTKSLKHGDHDQTDHGNWARGFDAPSSTEISRSPKESRTTTPLWYVERDAGVGSDRQSQLNNMQFGTQRTLHEALDAYTHWKTDQWSDDGSSIAFHAALNERLREGMNRGKAVEATAAEFAEEGDDQLGKTLYSGFMHLDALTRDSVMKEDTVVTRAMSPVFDRQELEAAISGGSLNLYGQEITAGAVFSDAGFVSTSLDTTGSSTQYFGQNWEGAEGLEDSQIPTSVRWMITVPAGAPAADLRSVGFSSQHGEQEVILPRNTHFQVDSYDVKMPPTGGGAASVTIRATVIPTHK